MQDWLATTASTWFYMCNLVQVCKVLNHGRCSDHVPALYLVQHSFLIWAMNT
jgi:hypothetical protein